MGRLRTVLGDLVLAPDALILPHEHLLCDFSSVSGQLDHILNEWELARDELAPVAAAGVGALVEVTPPDLGRDPAGLARIAQATGIGVVMATGWYRESFYPPEIDRRTVGGLAAEMIEELTAGVHVGDGRLVRAGVIGEIGTEHRYITAREERVFRAAARAARETGAPLTTHTGVYPSGVAQLELLLEAGAPREQIIIGHADMHLDGEYHRSLLRAGVMIQFDTTGRTHLNADERRADHLVNLIREGWLGQLMISSDRCFKSDLRAFGGVGYDHSVVAFARLLADRGVSPEEFGVLTRENPKRLFAWA